MRVGEKLRGALDLVFRAGIDLAVDESLFVDPEEAILFLQDKDKFRADRFYGVSKEDYLEWINGGELICCAKTSSGKQCKNAVKGANWKKSSYTPSEYIRLRGGYCHIHGG